MTLTPRHTTLSSLGMSLAPSRARHRVGWRLAVCLALSLGPSAQALANDEAPAASTKSAAPAKKAAPPSAAIPAASGTKSVTDDVKDAVQTKVSGQKQLTLVFDGKSKTLVAQPPKESPAPARATAAAPIKRAAGSLPNPADSRNYIRAKAAAMAGHGTEPADGATHAAGEVHWSYEGEAGPQAWGQLRPTFNVCAIGKRQSPINIEDSATLQGPAEPLRFNYQPSSGTVVNNGHTIQVDLFGDNTVTVRDSTFKLIQFHFHHPSEERVNYKGFSMVAHLVHKNLEGQLAVVAVLLNPGTANALVDKVWTHMPLDAGDRVRLPTGLINMNELLPKDQRYYQFMGSLTTPPCTEGVLWLVLKQPSTVSPAQIRLFSQLFPNNARPVQALNGRAVRDAQ